MSAYWPIGVFAFVFENAVRGAVLLGIGALAAWLCCRTVPAVRHVIWLSSLIGALCLPLLLALPIGIPIVPVPSAMGERNVPPSANAFDEPALGHTYEVLPAPFRSNVSIPRPSSGNPNDLRVHLVVVWAAGLLLLVLRLCGGMLRLRRLARDANPIPVKSMPSACVLHQNMRIVLAPGSGLAAPVTWGCLRPVILLPPDALEWPDAKLKWSLAHEMSHIDRKDWLWLLVGELACALHWYNPICWMAMRHMRAEAEMAADDRVLAAGANPTEYAAILLEVARTMKKRTLGLSAPALAPPAGIGARIRSVLDCGRNRGVVHRPVLIATMTLLAILFGGTGILRLTPMATAANDQSPSSGECKTNLQRLAVGLAMYIQDYDETPPPMRSQPQTQAVLLPYLKSKELFLCPDTHAAYQLNAKLSNVAVNRIIAPQSQITTFADATPHGGVWNVALLNGQVKDLTDQPNLNAPIELRPAHKFARHKPKPETKQKLLKALRLQKRAIEQRIRQLERSR